MVSAEVLVPFASTRAAPARQLRSTLVTSSMQSLRALGHYERYLGILDPSHKETLIHAVAGVWLAMDVGLAHYHACNALALTAQEQYAIGQQVGERVHGTLLGLLVRTAKGAGMTPWTGLTQCGRLYERLFVGGAVQLVKLGPKEARMDLENNPLCGITYYRNGFRGLVASGAGLFAAKAYVTDLAKYASPTSFAIKISWA